MRIHAFLPIATILAAAGCEVSDTDDGPSETTSDGIFEVVLPAGAARAALPDDVVSAIEDFEDINALDQSDSVPVSAIATYTGTAAFDVDAGDTAISARTDLTADFGSGDLTGAFSGLIVSPDGDPARSELSSDQIDIRNGVISGSDFTADVEGTFDREGDVVGVAGSLDGAFVEPGVSAAAGTVEATTVDSFGSGTLTGVFSAERN